MTEGEMGAKFLKALLLLICLASIVAAEDNVTVTVSEYDQEVGMIKVNYISMTIDENGVVSVSEEIVARRGDIVRIVLPKNLQKVQFLNSTRDNILFEALPQRDSQLFAFFLDESDAGSEEIVSIRYITQHLTAKSGVIWSLNYSTTTTPQNGSFPGTIIKLKIPKDTQITKIYYKDEFRWSPIGGSEIWIYPEGGLFHLNFEYNVGASGPIIPLPTTTSTTTTSTTTTTTVPTTTTTTPPNPLQSFINAYIMPFSLGLIILLLVIFLFLPRRRVSERSRMEEKEKPAGTRTVVDEGKDPDNQPVTYTINHDASHMGTGIQAPEGSAKVSLSPADATSKALKGSLRMVKDSIKNVLDENERQVVEILEKSEGEITQAYVYKSTGIPKSSLSDVIKRLEKRNIIERKKEGRTNWLKLKEWVFD